MKAAPSQAQSKEESNRSDDPDHNIITEKVYSDPELGRSTPPAAPLRKKSSGYRGVTAAASSREGQQAWRARIRFANKVINLGRCAYDSQSW